MAGANANSMDLTFSALSDPTRRAILARLASGDASVGDIAAPFDMSLPAVTKHLNVLENARLITRRREGRMRRCHLSPEPMNEAAEWIATTRGFWEGQLDRLSAYLERQQKERK